MVLSEKVLHKKHLAENQNEQSDPARAIFPATPALPDTTSSSLPSLQLLNFKLPVLQSHIAKKRKLKS